MFQIIISHLKKRLYCFYHGRYLNSMNEMEQFLSYIRRVQPEPFLSYKNTSSQKRIDFQTVMDELNLDLKDIKFLDVGPGYGDSLDICYENGAEAIDFVEYDPFFFTYNRLKGFTKGYQLNHLWRLNRLEHGKYNLIWVKGSISADFFIKMSKVISFQNWLTQLEILASPMCKIIICPHWSNDKYRRNIEDVRNNLFTKIMLNKGYIILPKKIRNHNKEPEYPITFLKNVTCTHNKRKIKDILGNASDPRRNESLQKYMQRK